MGIHCFNGRLTLCEREAIVSVTENSVFLKNSDQEQLKQEVACSADLFTVVGP